MLKLPVFILGLILFTGGCTQFLDAAAEEESNPRFFPPPEHTPTRLAECLLEYDCPYCGECHPIEFESGILPVVKPLPAQPALVYSKFRCRNTGGIFKLTHYQCDRIIWVDYWTGDRFASGP